MTQPNLLNWKPRLSLNEGINKLLIEFSMCGIAGTIYKKNYLPGNKAEVDEPVQLF